MSRRREAQDDDDSVKEGTGEGGRTSLGLYYDVDGPSSTGEGWTSRTGFRVVAPTTTVHFYCTCPGP